MLVAAGALYVVGSRGLLDSELV